MGRLDYCLSMKDKTRDLAFRINSIRQRLAANPDHRSRVRLRGELEVLEMRRESILARLQVLESEPEGTWNNLRADIEQEWDGLVQDFEERVGRLA